MNKYSITISYLDDVLNISAENEEDAINKVNKLIDEAQEPAEVECINVERFEE